MKLLPNDSGKMEFPSPYAIFLGAKNYTMRAFACRYWWRRLANDSELVYASSVFNCTAVALKRLERVNAFNLVNYKS